MSKLFNIQVFPLSALDKDPSFSRQGSYAVVTKGRLKNYDIHVAVKDFKDGFGEELLNEVAILSKLSHDNVIRLVGVIRDGFTEFPKILLEFMPCASLLEYTMQHLYISEDKVLKILLDITRGMSYIHDMGIIHRDLACRNILFDGKMTAKIADFGFSVQLRPEDLHSLYLFKPDEIKRIPVNWMPPESVTGLLPNSISPGIYSKKCDVWSFGAVIYEMYSKLPPFDSMELSSIPIAINQGATPMSYKEITLPPNIRSIMDASFVKCFEKRPTFSMLRNQVEALIKEAQVAETFQFKIPELFSKSTDQLIFTGSCETGCFAMNKPHCSTSHSQSEFDSKLQIKLLSMPMSSETSTWPKPLSRVDSGYSDGTSPSFSGENQSDIDLFEEDGTDAVVIENLNNVGRHIQSHIESATKIFNQRRRSESCKTKQLTTKSLAIIVKPGIGKAKRNSISKRENIRKMACFILNKEEFHQHGVVIKIVSKFKKVSSVLELQHL